MRVVAAPVFLATKLEAFADRGEGDYMQQDMEDIINLVAGRPELADEVRQSAPEVREYLRESFDELLADPEFLDKIEWHFGQEENPKRRVEIVIERFRALAGL